MEAVVDEEVRPGVILPFVHRLLGQATERKQGLTPNGGTDTDPSLKG